MAATQKKSAESPPKQQTQPAQFLFAAVAGLFLFVAALKFGAPIILDNYLAPPDSAWAAVFESWQAKWGYLMLAPLILAGLATIQWRRLNLKWPLVLPLLWLGWQFLSATKSIDPATTSLTLKYFSACVTLFYLGYFCMGDRRNPWPLWTGLALALCVMIRKGLEQHFGGLEATRRMFEQMKLNGSLPSALLNNPAYQARLASPRIFSTFSNADAFAGAIELLLPLTLVFLWQLTPKVRPPMRWSFVIILGGCGLACLYWSGSKGGWLVVLLAGLIALWRSPKPALWRQKILIWLLVIGAVLGTVKLRDKLAGKRAPDSYSLKKQQISVTTRISYWQAALHIAFKSPLLGTGPGTFAASYAQIKRPATESEINQSQPANSDFTRLCHNDYLEQACDSGIPGFIIYTAMIAGFLTWIYRSRVKKTQGLTLGFVVWLGVLTLALHSVVDYHLYVPSLAWPMFFLFGFLMNFEG